MKRFLFLFLLALVGVLSSCSQESDVVTSTNDDDSIETEETLNSIDLYGAMLSFNPNNGMNGSKAFNPNADLDELGLIAFLEEEGWLSFRSDEERFTEFLNNLELWSENYISLAKATDFSINREIAAAFTWNVIEPEKGAGYNWEISDAVLSAANESGMSISALIQPFAAWDQDSIPMGCKGLDFAYYDYKADTPTDWEAYSAFLQATVERYDGDGTDDMPGLVFPIKHWEIGNEYDGTCGGDLNEAENYFELIKISSEIIRETNPEAKVINMGALEIDSNARDIKGFWEDFFELGGGNYIDIFNFHYNQEKSGMSPTSEQFEEELDFFNEVMESNNAVKPMWLTEFGTYSGTPVSTNKQMLSSPTQTEAEQSAWYFRYSILAFGNGVEKIFVDLYGKDDDRIGGSALHSDEGEARPFLTTLQTIAKYLEGFSSVEELTEGQYRFEVDGESVYALWAGGVPAEITGTVDIISLDGTVNRMDARDVEFSEESPILLVPIE